MAWVSDESNGLFVSVPNEFKKETEAKAKDDIEREERGEQINFFLSYDSSQNNNYRILSIFQNIFEKKLFLYILCKNLDYNRSDFKYYSALTLPVINPLSL